MARIRVFASSTICRIEAMSSPVPETMMRCTPICPWSIVGKSTRWSWCWPTRSWGSRHGGDPLDDRADRADPCGTRWHGGGAVGRSRPDPGNLERVRTQQRPPCGRAFWICAGESAVVVAGARVTESPEPSECGFQNRSLGGSATSSAGLVVAPRAEDRASLSICREGRVEETRRRRWPAVRRL